MASDARDILGDAAGPHIKSSHSEKKSEKKSKRKKPDGMSNEVYGLLSSNSNDPHPLVPTFSANGGYKARARLSCNKARSWKWEEFENKARSDGLKLSHWTSDSANNQTSAFADFNRNIPFPTYSKDELNKHKTDNWSVEETEYMMDLCKRFDCRFILVHDRYDDKLHGKDRSVEEIKDRYYKITAPMNQSKNDTKVPYIFDIAHEKKRKKQLDMYLRRTKSEIDEQEKLREDIKRSEQKRRDKEKREAERLKFTEKTYSNLNKKSDVHQPEKKKQRKMSGYKSPRGDGTPPHESDESVPSPVSIINNRAPEFGLRFQDLKTGIHLQSHRMILPSSTSRKRELAIGTALKQFNVDPQPIATDRVTNAFNNLRSDIVKLRDCEVAIQHCDIELQALATSFKEHFPGKPLPEGIDPLVPSRKRLLSESSLLPDKKKSKNCH